ncbi:MULTISPECIES: fimbrial protein [Pseudomonas]|uniref:Type 1 fimbrial protein n=1 Tax=Pseudomonas sessilinigenes TaxID=658629 RepID=A0ABX8MUU7_9PSED|nr:MULTISPECIES: fimbrial protein [Pseudomonas]AZC23999.1 fimbrial subunit [Pseudomonas sessilinigenes]QXH42965.1 type 1 fimbrial protein [Pseudomonas sessilinigenes]UMZ14259.1 type 1 fimbrial protein [Pseudomonas sp. MPFS]
MKQLTSKLSLVVLASCIGVSPAAFCADGRITFTGNVTAQTCKINGNGSGSNDFTVTLPTVSSSALASTGQTAGRTPFSIALSDCTPKSGNVHSYFEPGSTVNTATGNLVLNSGGASNVEIGVLNNDLTAIKIGAADASQNSKSVGIDGSGSATLPFYAQYVATGTATAGAASSSVMYTLVYQ